MRPASIAACWLAVIAVGKQAREAFGIDLTVGLEGLDDRDRHRGVVGPHPLPAGGGDVIVELDLPCDRTAVQQLLAECIGDRKSFECDPCPIEPRVHSVSVTL